MNYITSVADAGIKKGMPRTVQHRELNVIRRLLQIRFGPLPQEYENRLIHANSDQLQEWAKYLFTAISAEDFFASAVD